MRIKDCDSLLRLAKYDYKAALWASKWIYENS
jgi:hypothetical protein